jgi:hypothetical protein
MIKKLTLFITLILTLYFFDGCAMDLTSVNYSRRSLTVASPSRPSWSLKEPADIPLKSWNTTKLRSGTKWDYVGSIAEGDVYSTEDQVVTAVGSNTYEANITLKGDEIVGLYLPVEEAFVDISKPVTISRTIN